MCTYCDSLLFRQGEILENHGKVASLVDDQSPIQVGTAGSYQKKSFTVVGRARQTWSEGFWNEWCLLFSDDTLGWLAEAQGFWMLSRQKDATLDGKKVQILIPGQKLELWGRTYLLDDRKEASIESIEGELPFRAAPGKKSLLLDLSTESGREFVTVDFTEPNSPIFYSGEYLEFDELKLQNLRALDGWKL